MAGRSPSFLIMRKKKYDSKNQMPIAFPPIISGESANLWTSLKRNYADCLIFLMQEGLYFTLGIDALVIHQITGYPLHKGDYIVCCFHPQHLVDVFKQVAEAGLRMAVCAPPDIPEEHIFN